MEIVFLNLSTEVYRSFPLHEHGYWEVILNLKGKGTATIAGSKVPFSEGTIFCIPPGTPHCKESEDGFTDACMFLKDFLPIGGREIGCYEDDLDRSFLRLFHMAYACKVKGEPNASAIINAIGAAMYQYLVGWADLQTDRNTLVERFQNLLMNNISNPTFDLSGEMRKEAYCTSHFRRLFKEKTGHPPLNYLQHLRMEHAKRLFQQYPGAHSIKEIALSSGYADPYYFSRMFKKYEGISPERYAKELGEFQVEKIAGAQLWSQNEDTAPWRLAQEPKGYYP